VSTTRAELLPNLLSDRRARDWIDGFLLLGVLVGLVGSLLIAWRYHIETDPHLIGLHFLALNAGYVIAVAIAQRLLFRISIRAGVLTGCAIGFASLAALSFAVPPISPVWRMLGLAAVGMAGGTLATALLYALEPYFSQAPAVFANWAGLLFGCGCLLSTSIIGITYFAGSVQIETMLLAIVPLIYFVLYANSKFPPALERAEFREQENRIRKTLSGLRSIAAILFGVLLFVQFGNEWAIAGWLPLFLIHRLGANPVWAIFALTAYFLALTSGRLIARSLLARINHRKLLLASIISAMIGCVLLSIANSMAAAWIAVVIIGAGFAPIYPLVAERLDDRFSYHPGFYNGIFSVAITGAMFAPWLLGYVDGYFGTRYVMLLPALGSIAVLVLALLIMLEAHLMSGKGGEKAPLSLAATGKN
jgi:MFS transporter, FHS family, glucose/mannose:H+ symporter